LKDLRDPQALGDAYLTFRNAGIPIDMAVAIPVEDYDGGGLMSNDPAKHHSKTKQDAYVESDGGE
jgi:hypothetical protein